MSDDVVIVSAARTPVGSFNGAFATMPAHDLGAIAIKAALERAGIEPGRVSEVIMGQILTAAQGQNPARQASIAAGIPVESPAWGVNQLCGQRPAHRGAGLPGAAQRRFRNRRRRRPGIHEHGPPCAIPARRHQNGSDSSSSTP